MSGLGLPVGRKEHISRQVTFIHVYWKLLFQSDSYRPRNPLVRQSLSPITLAVL